MLAFVLERMTDHCISEDGWICTVKGGGRGALARENDLR